MIAYNSIDVDILGAQKKQPKIYCPLVPNKLSLEKP